jgi:hypothetical protein
MSNLPENQVHLEAGHSDSKLAQSESSQAEEPEPITKPSLEDFMLLALTDLEGLTGVDSSDWSRWFNGALLSERILIKAAEPLGLTAGQLLDFISRRREATLGLRKAGRKFTPKEMQLVINRQSKKGQGGTGNSGGKSKASSLESVCA